VKPLTSQVKLKTPANDKTNIAGAETSLTKENAKPEAFKLHDSSISFRRVSKRVAYETNITDFTIGRF
jgi:hypothetical protein